MSFTRINYDSYRNKIYSIEIVGGKRKKINYSPKFEYYIPDQSGESKLKDIYGNCVKLVQSDTRAEMKSMAESLKTCETDIPRDIVFLQKKYKGQKLKADMDNFQVCTFDIEVAADKFPDPWEVNYPVNLITFHFSKENETYTFGTKPYTGNSPLVRNYHYCASEEILIEKAFTLFRKKKVDIVTGWNCLNVNGFVWLKDRIVALSEVKSKFQTFDNGEVFETSNIHHKKAYEIHLSTGHKIVSSIDHRFPCYFKNKNNYKYDTSILKNKDDFKLSDIINDIENTDFYLQMHLRQNDAPNYTIKQLILDNLKNMLSYSDFDIMISSKKIRNKVRKYFQENDPNFRSKDYYWMYSDNFFKRSSNRWLFKKLRKIISIDDIREMIEESDIQYFYLGGRKIYEININEVISNDMLKLLGLIYTDGHKSKDGTTVITNTNVGIIDDYSKIINTFRNKKLKNKFVKRKSTENRDRSNHKEFCRLRFSFRSSYLGLLFPFIFNDNRQKKVNIEFLSKLSFSQFTSFYSGCIDGDGCIDKRSHSIVFYNFNESDTQKFSNILNWNGVFHTYNDNQITIPNMNRNKFFYEKMDLSHNEKNEKVNTTQFFEFKNTRSKLINKFLYKDYCIVKINKIVEIDDKVPMMDIGTKTKYFVYNSTKVHNCRGFDIPYLVNRAKKLNIDISLSPINQEREITMRGYHVQGRAYQIAGISQLDGMDLYKNFVYQKRERYSLQFIGMFECGKGKKDYEGTINDAFNVDWNGFVEYNIQDVLLCLKIEEKKKHIQLCIDFCYQALIPFERIFSSINLVTGYMLSYMHNRGIVMPDRDVTEKKTEKFPGAYVMANPGFYKYLMSFDVASMYPHLIKQFNISPETLVRDPEDAETGNYFRCPLSEYKQWETLNGTKTFGGIYYRNDKKGILPEIVSDIYDTRKRLKTKGFIVDAIAEGRSLDEFPSDLVDEAKKEGESVDYYESQQLIRKILINCFHEDTEIITLQGIKKIKNVCKGDLVYSINTTTSNLEVKPVTDVYDYNYNGKMLNIKNTKLDLTVTHEHKLLECNHDKINFITANEFSKRSFNIVPMHSVQNEVKNDLIVLSDFIQNDQYKFFIKHDHHLNHIKKCFPDIQFQKYTKKGFSEIISYNSENALKIFNNGFLVFAKHKRDKKCTFNKVVVNNKKFSKLIGYYLSKGSLYSSIEKKYGSTVRGVCNKVIISQYKKVNPNIYDDIVECVQNVTDRYILSEENIYICNDMIFEILKKFGVKKQKIIFNDITSYLKLFDIYEGMYQGDGHKSQFKYTITRKNQQLFEDFMRLMLELGYVPRYYIEDSCYRIVVNKTNFKIRQHSIKEIDYKGKVYNLTVKDNHTVCVGQNGKFMWTGQSIYGVLGNEYFNFFNVSNAIAVTLGGQDLIRYLSNTINNYMKQNWHNLGPRIFPDHKGDWKPLKKDVCILIDTDSNFLCLDEVVQNMGLDFKTNENYYNWCIYLENKFFNPFFEKILNIYANKFKVPQMIDFKREKIITQKFILAKKKYADEIIANEKKIYIEKPKIAITGIELVRTDTPTFSRQRIMSVIEEIFESKGKDKSKVLDRLRSIHTDFVKTSITDIAMQTTTKDYSKWVPKPITHYLKNGKPDYILKMPMHYRASLNYNYMIAKYNLPLIPITDGTKMKYIFVSSKKNELHQNVIGFINEWPKQFDKMFYLDSDAQWNRGFKDVIQRFFDVLDWGEIQLESNTLNDFIQF